MSRHFDFRGKTVLITGAGSGIGRALAVALSARGARLALADREQTGLNGTIAVIEPGAEVHGYVLDVTDVAAIRALPDTIRAELGGLDVLINNAGIALGGTFEQVSEADFERLIDINFWGVVRMTRAFLPLLRRSPDARLVNMSSLFGLISPPGQAAYSASKFAVRGFSNVLAGELASTSVGVTVVHPGGVATSIAQSARRPKGLTAEEAEAQRAAAQKLLTMSPDRAADIILDGVRRRKSRVLVGTDAKAAALMERIAPVAHLSLLARMFAEKTPR